LENIKLKKLDNGITLITENLPDISTFSMGFFVKTGAMNETKKESGISRILTPTALNATPLSPMSTSEAVTPDPVQSQEKPPQTGSEKASFLAWIGLLGLGFLGGKVKYARRKS